MEKKIFLSIIVPAYNEEKIIKDSLDKIVDYLNGQKYSWEIIVVDDGSVDKTFQKANALGNKNVNLIRLPVNRGKGAALRSGVLKARGKCLIFTDADLSVGVYYIRPLLAKLDKYDVVIGSRRVKGSKIKVHQPFLREWMGRVFTFLTQLVLGSTITDFTCGFKGFNSEAGRKIFSEVIINEFFFREFFQI